MILRFGIFDGPRLVCVEDDAEIARKIANRLARETRRLYTIEPVEIVRVPTV